MNKALLSLVLLLSLSSAYAGSCNFSSRIDDCRVKAEQGDAMSQYYLGFRYVHGHRVRRDIKKGLKWLRKAAKQGYADAQYHLGTSYYNGRNGLRKDLLMAHMYWNLAAANGNRSALHDKNVITKIMTPSQLAEAQDLALEWMRKHE